MTTNTWILLIISNIFWALNPVFMKVLLTSYEPFQVAWIRYLSALLGFLVVLTFKRMKGPLMFRPLTQKAGLLILGAGLLTFFISPVMQISGLSKSRATDNALIIAIEPLLTVFLAWIFLAEKLKFYHGICFLFSFIGFILLSGGLSFGSNPFFIGNAMILASLVGEAAFSIFGRSLLKTYKADQIFFYSLMFGAFLLTALVGISVGFPTGVLSSFEQQIAVIWIGPLGTALTYWFWMKALESASVASVCLTLFIQPLLGSVAGPFFLKESLNSVQWLGASVILLSLLFQIRFDLKK